MQHPGPLKHSVQISRGDELLALWCWDPLIYLGENRLGRYSFQSPLGSRGSGVLTRHLTTEAQPQITLGKHSPILYQPCLLCSKFGASLPLKA